jgi:integrase
MQKESLQDRRLVKTSTPGVYKRGNRYVVVYRDPRGRQRKAAARTLAEARDLRAQLRADVVRGEYRAQSRVTFEDYARQWLASYGGRTARGNVRSTTAREYRRYTEQRAIPYFGRRRLSEIEPRDVKAYAAHVAAQGVARNTVRNCVAALRVLLATAVEDGLIRTNPAAGVRLPAMPMAEPDEASPKAKALTDAELAALLAACPAQWQLLVSFLADTGLRLGEASALRWCDIDFGRRRVLVRRQWTHGSYAPPKSRYGRRDVPLTPELARQLWERRKTVHGADDALVWPGRSDRPLNAASAHRAVRAAGETAGVPWAHPHALRHTCATRLFRAGLNAKQVQVWMGHHSPAFTLATYVHLLDDDLPDAPFGGIAGGNAVATSPTESEPNMVRPEVAVTA